MAEVLDGEGEVIGEELEESDEGAEEEEGREEEFELRDAVPHDSDEHFVIIVVL